MPQVERVSDSGTLDTSVMRSTTQFIAFGVLAVALLSPLGALGAFQTGYWNLVDSSYLLMLGAGVLGGVWCLMRRLGGSGDAPAVPASALALLVLAGVGGLAALQADHPRLALMGGYQSGFGPLWYAVLAILVIVAGDCLRRPKLRLAVSVLAICVAFVIAALLAYTRLGGAQVLIPAADHYALIGLMLFFLPLPVREGTRHERFVYGVGCVVALALIVLTGNRTVLALAAVGAAVTFFAWRFPAQAARGARLPAVGVAALTVVAMAALPAAYLWGGMAGIELSLGVRAGLASIVEGAMAHAGADAWLLGHGWGHMQFTFFQYLQWADISFLDDKWDLLWRDMFHSHNLVLETLHATGLVGLLALAAFFAAIYAGAPDHRRFVALLFVVGYGAYNALWYDMAFHVPFVAIAVAGLSGTGSKPRDAKPPQWRLVAATAGLGLASVFSVFLVQQMAFASAVTAVKAEARGIDPLKLVARGLPEDPRGTAFVRTMVYRDVIRDLGDTALSDAQKRAVALFILHDVAARLPGATLPELPFVASEAFNNAHFNDSWSWAKPLAVEHDALWTDASVRMLELAPYRTDLLVPYLSQRLVERRLEEVWALTARMREYRTNDPVGLYYQGAVLTQDADPAAKQQGLTLIAMAIDQGIDRYLEVPGWLHELVAPYRARTPSAAVTNTGEGGN